MHFQKRALLQKLKKEYGYELAVNKRAIKEMTDPELLDSLLIVRLDAQLVDAINEFITDGMEDEEELESSLVVVMYVMEHRIKQVLDSANEVDPKLKRNLINRLHHFLKKEKK